MNRVLARSISAKALATISKVIMRLLHFGPPSGSINRYGKNREKSLAIPDTIDKTECDRRY
jgi:hypothetical protein